VAGDSFFEHQRAGQGASPLAPEKCFQSSCKEQFQSALGIRDSEGRPAARPWLVLEPMCQQRFWPHGRRLGAGPAGDAASTWIKSPSRPREPERGLVEQGKGTVGKTGSTENGLLADQAPEASWLGRNQNDERVARAMATKSECRLEERPKNRPRGAPARNHRCWLGPAKSRDFARAWSSKTNADLHARIGSGLIEAAQKKIGWCASTVNRTNPPPAGSFARGRTAQNKKPL